MVAIVVGKHERTCPHPSAEGRGTVGGRFVIGRSGSGGGGGVCLLGPHPSHEGRGLRSGGWVRLGLNWGSEGEVVVVEE